MSTDTGTARHPEKHRQTWLGAVGVLAASAILILFRVHAFDLPLETDECNYAYIGAKILEGARLYVDVWDHQPFGVFVLFASVIRVFGDAPEVFRWMAVAFSLTSLGFVFALLRQTSGLAAGIVGALLFALVSSDPGTGGEGCNREIYMNTLILAAWYLAVCTPMNRRAALLLSGAALGLGSAIKTLVAIHWLALVIWLIFFSPRNRRTGQRLADAGLLTIGPLALWLAAFGYFATTHRFSEFADAVFLFNIGYSGTDEGFFTRFVQFFTPKRHPFIFDSALPLWITGAAGTFWLLMRSCVRARTGRAGERPDRICRRHAAAFALLVVASFVAVCLPGRFWPHYYYLLIPPMVLAAALLTLHVAGYMHDAIAGLNRRTKTLIHAVAITVVFGAVLATQYRDYLRQDPLGITVKRYNSRDFWGRGHGENVRSVTKPDDSIFVYSNDASIYYYSRRRCASRYTMITGLGTGMAGAERRRSILIDELRADPPRLILIVLSEDPFPAWRAFLQEHYGEPIGWDFHDKRRNEAIMVVLCRKGEPVRSIDWNWDRSSIASSQASER